MIKMNVVDSIVLEYDEERDRMLAVVTVGEGDVVYKCQSVTILNGLLCMIGICTIIG